MKLRILGITAGIIAANAATITASKAQSIEIFAKGVCKEVAVESSTLTDALRENLKKNRWYSGDSNVFALAQELANNEEVAAALTKDVRWTYFMDDDKAYAQSKKYSQGDIGYTLTQYSNPNALNWALDGENCETQVPDTGGGGGDLGDFDDVPVAIVNPTTDDLVRFALNVLPRNPIATGGKSLQEYQNDLADTIFERAPLRRFIGANDSTTAYENTITEAGIELTEVSSLPAQYLEQEGFSAWVKSFGGDTSAFQYIDSAYGEFGNWKSRHSGITTGVDYAFSDNFKIGGFGNWGSVSVTYLGLAGGNWNPQGWGGGLTANYTEENFYAQALLSATSFSGTHNRYLLSIGNFEGRTATATKTTTSYLGALRIGSPQQWGKAVIEPQLTGSWVHNEDHPWSESGGDVFNIHYKSYSDNFLQTLLAVKVSLPVNSGDRALFNPFIRAGWIADWDLNNGDAKVENIYTGASRGIPIVQDNEHGLLLEGGLDYTINNLGSTSFKLYAKGGIELWDNDQKDTDWRVSGGVTFTFGGAPKGSPKAEVVEEVIIEPAPEPAPVRGLW